MLFLETSPAPTLRNSYIELPVSNFLLTDQVKSGDLTPLFSLSASRKNATQKKILDSNKIKQYIAETWGCSPITIPDTKEVVESLMKIERHKRAVCSFAIVGFLNFHFIGAEEYFSWCSLPKSWAINKRRYYEQ